jgi:hypothetical protein
MLQEVSYFLIFGKPVIMYLGIVTLVTLLLTATIPVLNKKGIRIIPFSWHQRCAALAISLAIIHGILGVLAYY